MDLSIKVCKSIYYCNLLLFLYRVCIFVEVPMLPCPLPQCEHQFRRKDNLIRHLQLTHNQAKEEAHESIHLFTINSSSKVASECNERYIVA